MWRLAPRQLRETELSMDRRVPRLDREGTIASSNFAGVGGSFLCVFLFVPINPTNWWRLVQTLVRPEFREDQFAEQNLVAPGVKCHVTWHVIGNAARRWYLQKKKTIWSNCNMNLRFG